MISDPFDVTGVQPMGRTIVRAMAEAYVANVGSALVTLVAHGSAVKGGVIRGSSDVDLVAFVEPSLLMPGDELPLDRALELHRDLARIDPSPFRYLQGHVYPVGGGPRIGFIPGTYHVIWGSPDVPIATPPQLLDAAWTSLQALDPAGKRAQISNALLDHGEDRLDRQVRWLCTDVWPVIYQVACLIEGDGTKVWRLTKHQVVHCLQSEPNIGPAATAWFEAVTAHYATGETVPTALQTIHAGVALLDAAKAWAEQR